MIWQYLYLTASFFASVMMMALTVYAFRNRDRPIAAAFGVVTLVAAVWAFGGVMLALSGSDQIADFWLKVMFTAIAVSAVALLSLVLHYRGYGDWLNRRRIALLLIFPLLTWTVIWTNPYHQLFHGIIEYEDIGLILTWDAEFNLWFWLHSFYSYLLSFIAIVLLIGAVISSSALYRRQALALLVASLLPIAASAASTFHWIPGVRGSITNLSFVVTCLMFAWGIFRYRLFTLLPIARSRLVQIMNDGMLVIDAQDRIVDINPAMQAMIAPGNGGAVANSVPRDLVGRRVDEVFGAQEDILECILDPEDTLCEICLQREGKTHYYDLKIATLTDKGDRKSGRLILLRDISERIEMEAALIMEQERSDKLLLNILPEPIAYRLKHGETNISDGYESASVLFADLVGFTPFSERLSPDELVNILNEVFSRFDRLVEKHTLEKIKTIGDGYMVVAGVPIPREDHAQAIASLALEMLRDYDQYCKQAMEYIPLRIGINSGPLVAGVIGVQKFAYDLWGDTVTTASRMETHGLPGKIQVSERTYHLLADSYELEPRGEIDVRGKGPMSTWFLEGIRDEKISPYFGQNYSSSKILSSSLSGTSKTES
jgi:class 3 adenylate cyclase